MHTSIRRFSALAACTAVAVVLFGCASNVSRGITDDGRATQLVFPSIESDAWKQDGIFPNLENLRAVGPGVTKDQLYDLLGPPHFGEGMSRVREWDYVFNFRSGAEVTRCQYKVIFDQAYRAQTFHWQPAACAGVLTPRRAVEPIAAVVPIDTKPAPGQREVVTLDVDGLFRFGGSKLADLLPEGRRRIEQMATDIQERFKTQSIVTVTGHTDRLGSEAYNRALSRARADTVRDLLIARGLPSGSVRANGVGKSQPLAKGCEGVRASALVQCLQPDRRVEVEIIGAR